MKKIEGQLLARKWFHSHEEDSATGQVWRAEGFDFPRSRGRKSMELRADGVAIETGPGPDDRRVTITGNWSFDVGSVARLKVASGSEATRKWLVLELEGDRMVLAPSAE